MLNALRFSRREACKAATLVRGLHSTGSAGQEAAQGVKRTSIKDGLSNLPTTAPRTKSARAEDLCNRIKSECNERTNGIGKSRKAPASQAGASPRPSPTKPLSDREERTWNALTDKKIKARFAPVAAAAAQAD